MTAVLPTPSPLFVDGVHYAWGEHTALDQVSLELQRGELFGLLGPNGAGKTTLISLIAGLLKPTKGCIRVQGHHTVNAAVDARQSTGFVFQSASLDRFMTVQQNLEFAAGLQGFSKHDAAEKLDSLYKIFPIKPWLKKPAGALSGGQRRLVDIARALVHEPELLLLDEPTNALDVPSKNMVWNTLETLRNTCNITILVATHLMDEAQSCDRVGFLNHGKLGWVGTPAEAMDELPNPTYTQTRTATLADWFVWKMKGQPTL